MITQTGHQNPLYRSEAVLTAHHATTQWMRVAVTALLTMVDLLTCLQDWEFPFFSTPTDILVVGTWLPELECGCLSNLMKAIFRKCTCIPQISWDFLRFHMSAKWIAYMPAFGALGVDWWYMCRTIFTYHPQKLGEYERPEDCGIFVISDRKVLDIAYSQGKLIKEKAHLITYEARAHLSNSTDTFIQSKFCDDPPYLKFIPLACGILAGIGFIVLIFRAEYYWDNFAERNTGKELGDRLMAYQEEAAAHSNEQESNQEALTNRQ